MFRTQGAQVVLDEFEKSVHQVQIGVLVVPNNSLHIAFQVLHLVSQYFLLGGIAYENN